MNATRTIHVIGAGLSGLAAAVRLVEAGERVIIHEAAGQAGGRCRSFHDRTLDRIIDNGNHLIMSGNAAALSFLDRIGSVDPLVGPQSARYPFVDISTGARWIVEINDGVIPRWVFDPARRVPGSKMMDYVKAAQIILAGPEKTVAQVVDRSNVLYKTFWEPLTLAVLNTTPELGQARLLWSVIRETFLLGGAKSRPLAARLGLGPAFIEPALAFLHRRGGEIRYNTRLRAVDANGDVVRTLNMGDHAIELAEDDRVIISVPPSRLKQIFPELDPPDDNASILNVHYRVGKRVDDRHLHGGPFIGLVSADAHWAFVRDDVVSLTVSASHAIGMDEVPNDDAARAMWRETQIALGLEGVPYEAVRVIRERRATPDQSPAGVAKRLAAKTRWRNAVLAGDHTQTGVPATIEGSIRSGDRAAEMVLRK